MQFLAEEPILPPSMLQVSLSQSDQMLTAFFDALSLDDLSKIWTMLSVPYRPSVSYSVRAVPLKEHPKEQQKATSGNASASYH